MIVYCEKCSSKFQVDDAKIPDAGIKARCSVCSHAFLLKKEPVVATPAPSAQATEEPATTRTKPANTSVFETSVFKDTASATQRQNPLMGSGGPFFSQNSAETAPQSVTETTSGDIVVEIAESNGLDEEIYAVEEQGSGSLAEAFSAEPAASDKPAATYDAFAAFVDRHKQEPAQAGTALRDVQKPTITTEQEKAAGAFSAVNRHSAAGPTTTKSASDSAPISAPRFPEVVTSVDSQLPAIPVAGTAERGIITKLDDCGMNDEYVVQMVQEVCQAVKYVEGMEKPDWPTRMMGLEMLCKIRGLYASEKREDPTNRQVQIVAGINM